jgi:O-antigen ligase
MERRRITVSSKEIVFSAFCVISSSWLFGGNAWYVETPLCLLFSINALLVLRRLFTTPESPLVRRVTFYTLITLSAFNCLVLVSLIFPAFREVSNEAGVFLVPNIRSIWLPTSINPQVSLQRLWWLDVCILNGLTVFLYSKSRQQIRNLLLLLALSCIALCILGTLQKLTNSRGPFFGLQEVRNKSFFSTFLYHNHWGIFSFLSLAFCLSQIRHYFHVSRNSLYRDFFHSPGMLYITAVFLILGTLPLSTSRSCTFLGLLLCLVALIDISRSFRGIVDLRRNPVIPVTLVICLLAASISLYSIAAPYISPRLLQTSQQIRDILNTGTIGSRAILYHDSFDTFTDRPVFGHGLGSYPYAFFTHNTQKSIDRLPVFYEDAHSDILQAFCELGLVGTVLLSLCFLLPVFVLYHALSTLGGIRILTTAYVFVFCYSAVEFPFACPAVVMLWWFLFFAYSKYALIGSTPCTQHSS